MPKNSVDPGIVINETNPKKQNVNNSINLSNSISNSMPKDHDRKCDYFDDSIKKIDDVSVIIKDLYSDNIGMSNNYTSK